MDIMEKSILTAALCAAAINALRAINVFLPLP